MTLDDVESTLHSLTGRVNPILMARALRGGTGRYAEVQERVHAIMHRTNNSDVRYTSQLETGPDSIDDDRLSSSSGDSVFKINPASQEADCPISTINQTIYTQQQIPNHPNSPDGRIIPADISSSGDHLQEAPVQGQMQPSQTYTHSPRQSPPTTAYSPTVGSVRSHASQPQPGVGREDENRRQELSEIRQETQQEAIEMVEVQQRPQGQEMDVYERQLYEVGPDGNALEPNTIIIEARRGPEVGLGGGATVDDDRIEEIGVGAMGTGRGADTYSVRTLEIHSVTTAETNSLKVSKPNNVRVPETDNVDDSVGGVSWYDRLMDSCSGFFNALCCGGRRREGHHRTSGGSSHNEEKGCCVGWFR